MPKKMPVNMTMAIAAALTLSACAETPCRKLRQPELANQPGVAVNALKESAAGNAPPPTPAPVAAGATPATATTPKVAPAVAAKPSPTTRPSTLLIFKPDGSKQCGTANGATPEEMERQLLAGVKVYSRDKRPDGLMHIQVCGSPTGMINVFEISTDDLSNAEKRGFKRFDPR